MTRSKIIDVMTYTDEFLVRIDIPVSIEQGSHNEWEYICSWLDNNIREAVTWEE